MGPARPRAGRKHAESCRGDGLCIPACPHPAPRGGAQGPNAATYKAIKRAGMARRKDGNTRRPIPFGGSLLEKRSGRNRTRKPEPKRRCLAALVLRSHAGFWSRFGSQTHDAPMIAECNHCARGGMLGARRTPSNSPGQPRCVALLPAKGTSRCCQAHATVRWLGHQRRCRTWQAQRQC